MMTKHCLACFDPILDMDHLNCDSTQPGTFKLEMETQIKATWFNLAHPKVPKEKHYWRHHWLPDNLPVITKLQEVTAPVQEIRDVRHFVC